MRIHSMSRDITKIEPAALIQELQLKGKSELAVDFIICGPPCQAFARVGRAKLREVAAHPDAFRIKGYSDLRHGHPRMMAKPKVVESTGNFHHEITDGSPPDSQRILHHPAARDTTSIPLLSL
jgi:hypothetical protein